MTRLLNSALMAGLILWANAEFRPGEHINATMERGSDALTGVSK